MEARQCPVEFEGHILNVHADIPDIRDRMYEPALIPPRPEISPPGDLHILNQGKEGACTGFALAAVINLLNQRQNNKAMHVSTRMLYEMARKFDEWPGEDYSGSSCRGAIRGWYNMGVCLESDWPYTHGRTGRLTVKRAKAARKITIGAYYRLRPDVADFHAALNEAEVLYTSAYVHNGWSRKTIRNGRIPFENERIGAHAFAIVGYNDEGFFVQNSWGENWGNNGVALWSYEDWLENIKDGWVVQLARPTPQIFPGRANTELRRRREELRRDPPRSEIMGHFVHLDDGNFHDTGRYFSNLEDVRETAELVAKSPDYKHLLFYAHGGLNSTDASARRIAAMKDTFKANGIYSYHFMYDTGLGEELKDVIVGRRSETSIRAEGFTDWSDRLIEWTTRRAGRALWREMKQGAQTPFNRQSADGVKVIRAFTKVLAHSDKPKKIHIAGHSNGAVLMAYWLEALTQRVAEKAKVISCSLMAPAATLDLFETHYRPQLQSNGLLEEMAIYNLIDELERDDQVAGIYRKSLLYLVSRAFEESVFDQEEEIPLLGMEKYSKTIDVSGLPLTIIYSQGNQALQPRSASASHGGFDNDPATMNDILHRILGEEPQVPFTKENLEY